MTDKLTLNDLPKDLQKQVKKENGISTKHYALTKNDIRTYSISVLNIIRNLKPSERKRVLQQATKLNEI